MVGNVGINRVLANCLDFTNITSIQQMVFQSPGGFEATQYPYFYQAAREVDIRLAQRVIRRKISSRIICSLFLQPF